VVLVAEAVECNPAVDLIAVHRPIAAVVVAGPMVGVVVAAVLVVARKTADVLAERRGCIESVGQGYRQKTASFGIGDWVLGRQRTGRIRGAVVEVADIHLMGHRRTIVGETCRVVGLMLWSLGSAG
jgi:hypothetical protein